MQVLIHLIGSEVLRLDASDNDAFQEEYVKFLTTGVQQRYVFFADGRSIMLSFRAIAYVDNKPS